MGHIEVRIRRKFLLLVFFYSYKLKETYLYSFLEVIHYAVWLERRFILQRMKILPFRV